MHTFTAINTHLKELALRKDSSDGDEVLATTEKLIAELVALFGIPAGTLGMSQLFQNPRVQSEIARFMPAPGFRRQAASYTIPHTSDIPLDLKLFWFKKTSKTNLAWAMWLTPNFEDSPENFANRNISIDFVIPPSGDRLLIMLSSNYKLRVLELHQSLTHTQREIFEKWLKGSGVVNEKAALHAVLWESFDFEPINKQFYKDLLQYFDVLTSHLERGGINKEASKLFAVRLIGRLLFLWFVEKKGFLNSEKHYFHVSASEDQTAYYRAKLEPLFFEVLNTEIKQRKNNDTETPFLNGGLFEAIDIDFHGNRKITFPDQFFSGLYERLNHYNFTVDEGTSEYEQVAIDPEMLGRVFENLLASISDETGTQARKAKGAFYTPREIVDYMCKESLIAYLAGKLSQKNTATKERIRELVTMSESTFRDQDHNKRRNFERDIGKEDVRKALGELRVLDPAVGSGAFPMGMLHLLVKVYSRVDPLLEKKSADLKRAILSESLYGVDIDQMAIQITRLRAWLSILVDMEDLKKVEPLPNLEFKFVCANTLIPLATDFAPLGSQVGLKEILIEIRDEYYSATRKSDKDRIRKKYLAQIFDSKGLFAGMESKRQQQLKSYDPFNPLASCGFYDPNLMHGVEAFDVVIGNPPYGADLSKEDVIRFKKLYELKTSETAILFIEKAYSLLKKTGILSYIIPKSFCFASNYEKARDYVSDGLLQLVDAGKPFEEVKFEACVLVVGVSSNLGTYESLVFTKQKEFIHKATLDKKLKEKFGLFLNGVSECEIKLAKKIMAESLYLNDISTNQRGAILQKFISEDGDFDVIGGAQISRFRVSGVKGKIKKNDIHSKQAYVKANSVLVQRIVAHIQNPKDRIMIIASPVSNTELILVDTINQITLNNNTNPSVVSALLNSHLINWFAYRFIFGMAIRTMQFDNPTTARIPISKNLESSPLLPEIEKLVSEITTLKTQDPKANTQPLETQINHLVYQLYNLTPEEIRVVEES